MNIRPIVRSPRHAQTPDCSAPAGRPGFGVGLIFGLPQPPPLARQRRISFVPVPGLPLMAHCCDPYQFVRRRVFIESDIARVSVRDNEFSQPRAAADGASYFRVLLQDDHGAAYFVEVFERSRPIAPQIEFKDVLHVRERIGREDDHADHADHAMVRAFGRAGFPPLARSRK